MDSIDAVATTPTAITTSPSASLATGRVRPSLVIDTNKSRSFSQKGGSKGTAEEERRARIRREKEEREQVERAQREEIQRRQRELLLQGQDPTTATQQSQHLQDGDVMNQAGAASGAGTMMDNGIHSHAQNAQNNAILMAKERDNGYEIDGNGTGSGSNSQMRDHFDDGQGMEDDQHGQPEEHGHGDNEQDQEDDHEGEEDEEEEEEDEDEEDDQLSSSPSVPDEHIDFDLVYALHTFLATVEGQASVVKGDQLTLLDDTNSYWWLVRVLKTQAVGYIPAENIETPFERLARLNKHRNVGITFATDQDMATGEGSSLAQTRFAQPHHPLNKALQIMPARPPVQLNPALAGGGRFVDFAPPTYHEHEGPYYTDESGETDGEYDDPEGAEEGEESEDDDQGSNDSFEGGSLEEHNALHREQMQLQQQQQQQAQSQGLVYSEGDAYGGAITSSSGSGEGEEISDDDRRYHARQAQQLRAQQQSQDDEIMEDPVSSYAKPGQQVSNAGQPELQQQQQRNPLQPISRTAQAQSQAALGVAGGYRPGMAQQQTTAAPQSTVHNADDRSSLKRKVSVDEQLRQEKEATSSPPALRAQQQQQQQGGGGGSPFAGGQNLVQQASNTSFSSNSSGASGSRLKPFSADALEGSGSSSHGHGQNKDDRTAETRKISLTPKIARDDSADSNLSDRAMSPAQNNQQQQRQPLRQVSNASIGQSADQQSIKSNNSGSGPAAAQRDLMAPTLLEDDYTHYRRGSAGSGSSASSKRTGASSPANGESTSSSATPKKKKSGGILGGLFSRKKDKSSDGGSGKEKEKDGKKGSGKNEGSRKVSGASSTTTNSTSDDDRASSTSSPAPDSPDKASRQSPQLGGGQTQQGIVSQQLQQRRATEQAQEEMFGTTAALRQQQVEAQNAMFHQYGIHPRNAGDVTNTSSFSNARAGGQQQDSTGQQHLQAANMTLSPSSASAHSSLSGSAGPGAQRLRPGSLIGSPHMPGTTIGGADAPTLNVLRVFAGENVVAEATFKTVLLNETTTTEDLVKQAMQRFRLAPPVSKNGATGLDVIMQEYYLTAKEVSGDETLLEAGQKPLKIFETLSEAAGFLSPGQGLPSVKRSSVGSINSIASNLSLNPAIEKLRMSDFGDDSTVKLFINKRTPDERAASTPMGRRASSDSTSTIGKRTSEELVNDPHRLSATGSIVDKGPAPGMPSSPLLRFAVRILIHPGDLPDSMVFDPISAAIIPKSALAERQQQAMTRSLSSSSSFGVSPDYREKVIFFPRNANVSEVLETALDRLGIVEGVVDGGDVVEDRVSKRRSMSRVRYCLSTASMGPDKPECILDPSAKLLDAYDKSPIFKHYERNSKEFRRRSMDAPYNTPSGNDLQPSDPTFIIRKAGFRPPLEQVLTGSKSPESQLLRPDIGDRGVSTISNSTSGRSLYSTPMSELPPNLERAMSPQQSTQDIIAAQRAASRANQQKTMFSAQKNSHQGVDVLLEDKTRIRSSKDSSNTMRYSYVGVDGSELDISEIVEKEWRTGSAKSSQQTVVAEDRSASATPVPIPPRDSPSALSYTTTDSFTSALASPMMSATGSAPSRSVADGDEEELRAVQELAGTPVSIDRSRDHLQEALGRRAASPALSTSSQQTNDNIHERLDRVLAKVKAGGGSGGVAGGIASALRNQTVSPSPSTSSARYVGGKDSLTRSDSAMSNTAPPGSAVDNKPSYVAQALRARSGSNTSSGRASPAPQAGGRLTPQQQLDSHPGAGGSTPKGGPIISTPLQKQSSAVLSDASSSSERTGSPSTPATTSAGNATLTPVSSTRNESSLGGRVPMTYRADFGLDFLMSLVDLEAPEPRPIRRTELSVEEALRGGVPFPNVSQEVASWYEQPRKKLDDLDARLDRLLERALSSSA